MTLPQLKPTGNNPGDENNGMLGDESFLLQFDPGRIRQRPVDCLRHILREGWRHRMVQEHQEPPERTDHPDKPETTIKTTRASHRLSLHSWNHVLVLLLLILSILIEIPAISLGNLPPPQHDHREP